MSIDGQPAEPWSLASAEELERAVAASMRVLREKTRGSVADFAHALSRRLGRNGLSRQAIYDWESRESRVPAVAWIAAAQLAGLTPDEALRAGWKRARPGGGS